jgi:hypothetical protein
VRLSEPVNGVVANPDPELAAEPIGVVVSQLAPDLLGSVIRRIPDDRVGVWPFDLQCVCPANCGQVGERQNRFVEPEFLNGQLVRHPQRYTRELDGEWLELESVDIRERVPRSPVLRRATGPHP